MADPTPVIPCSRSDGKVAELLRERGAETPPLILEVDWRPLPDRYLLGEGRVAERLTMNQLPVAIMKKTLFQTAIDLRATVPAPVFILEGEGLNEYSAIHPNAARGAISALMIEYAASVLRTADVEETTELIAMMGQYAQFGVPAISLAAKRKAESPADEQRRVIEMLPGVGFTLARRLLQHFGSIERIMKASPEKLAEVRGLSRRGAPRILDVFCREYCAVDFERDIEDVLAEKPELLFDGPVTLVDRQHFFRPGDDRRLIADLIVADDENETVYVVEIKRGALQKEDARQLGAYLDSADNSKTLGEYMRKGYGLHGILAAPDTRIKHTDDERIEIRLIDTRAIAEELMQRRLKRLRVRKRRRRRG